MSARDNELTRIAAWCRDKSNESFRDADAHAVRGDTSAMKIADGLRKAYARCADEVERVRDDERDDNAPTLPRIILETTDPVEAAWAMEAGGTLQVSAGVERRGR